MSDHIKPMRMQWGFVLRFAREDMRIPWGEEISPGQLVEWLMENRKNLGITGDVSLEEAKRVIENPEAFTDGQP